MMSAGDIRYSENIPHHSEAYVLYVNLNTTRYYLVPVCHLSFYHYYYSILLLRGMLIKSYLVCIYLTIFTIITIFGPINYGPP